MEHPSVRLHTALGCADYDEFGGDSYKDPDKQLVRMIADILLECDDLELCFSDILVQSCILYKEEVSNVSTR